MCSILESFQTERNFNIEKSKYVGQYEEDILRSNVPGCRMLGISIAKGCAISTCFRGEKLESRDSACNCTGRTRECNMPVASVFTELSAMALATGTRFMFPDAVLVQLERIAVACITKPKRVGNKNIRTTVYGSRCPYDGKKKNFSKCTR